MKKYSSLFRLFVEDGKKTMQELEYYKHYMRELKDGTYIISIKKQSKKRSLQQNNYYWFVMTLVSQEIGYDSAEEVHNAMKLKFLVDMKKKIPFIKSTASLSTQEMSEYMQKVFRFVEDVNDGLGLKVPSPEESYILIENDE